MSSFTSFQTVKRDSIFTRLDFRPKLFMVICVTLVAFLWESPITGGVLMLLITLAGLTVGVTWKYIRTVYILMFGFGLMLIFFHGFFNKDGVTALVHGAKLTPIFTFPRTWFLIGGLDLPEGILYAMNALYKSLPGLIIPWQFSHRLKQYDRWHGPGRNPLKNLLYFYSTYDSSPYSLKKSNRSFVMPSGCAAWQWKK